MSIAAEYLKILVHPEHKTSLATNPNETELFEVNGDDHFPIKENVPILLNNKILSEENPSELHYRAHYQNDAAIYDYTQQSENPIEKEEINRLHQTISAQIPSNALWVLDAGCGGAWLAKSLVQKNQNIISMDISDINPIKAIKNIPAKNHFGLVADVFHLPFQSNSIDCIVASEIIEHVPDPQKFIAALYEVLKPGGKLIITTPYNEIIRTSLCIHCNHETPHNAHLHSFTDEKIKRIAPQNARKISTKIFNNKLLVKTHFQHLFRFLPLPIWQICDQFGNAITKNKAYRLMLIIEK